MSGGRESGGLPTELGEDDEVLGVALRAGHARRAVAALLLVHPALQARLVHPLGGAPAAAWPDPLGSAVVLVGGEAHPAAPGTQADVQRGHETGGGGFCHTPSGSNHDTTQVIS